MILEKCSTSCSLTEVSWKSGRECVRRTALEVEREAIRLARWRESMVVSGKEVAVQDMYSGHKYS